MSKVLVSESNLYDIADSIRAKLGTQREYTPGQMSEAIDNISGGGGEITVESLAVTQNGTYTAPTGKAYSPVSVNVPGGGSTNILSGTDAPTASVGSDGAIYLQYGVSGYTALEYLEVSTAGAYIDSGMKLSDIDGFDIDFEITANIGNNNGVYGYNSAGLEICINYWNQLYVSVDNGSVGISPVIGRHKVEARASSLTVDNTLRSYAPRWSRAPGSNAYIFAFNNGGTPSKVSNTRIYSVIHYRGSNELQHLIPARRNSDSVLGMYDLVNDVFYTNSGTDSFIAGEETEFYNNYIRYAYLKVSGAWQPLIGSDIDDVNTGN